MDEQGERLKAAEALATVRAHEERELGDRHHTR